MANVTDVGGGYSYHEYSHYALYFSVRQNEITENKKRPDGKFPNDNYS